MRSYILAAAAIAFTSIGLVLIPDPIAEASPGRCLTIRNLGHLTRVDDMTMIAMSKTSDRYVVKMRQACPDFKRPGNYYVIRTLSPAECFDHDDALTFRDGGVCFIQSVRPMSGK